MKLTSDQIRTIGHQALEADPDAPCAWVCARTGHTYASADAARRAGARVVTVIRPDAPPVKPSKSPKNGHHSE